MKQLLLRIALFALFTFSAISKFLVIDDFEVYIYSLNLFSLNTSFLIARGVICIELILAFSILVKTYPKTTKYSSIALTIIFSIFLLIQLFHKNDDNCFCFGEALKLSPLESLLKNIPILASLFLLETKNKFEKFKLIQLFVAIAIPSLLFIISPPDFIFKEEYSKDLEIDSTALKLYVTENDSLSLKIPNKGYFLLNLYSNTCKHCKKLHEKIGIILQNNSIPSNNAGIIFWGDSLKTEKFFQEHPPILNHAYLSSHDFLRLTKGKMPITILLLDGEIVKLYNSRSIDENEIVKAFSQKE